MQVSYREARDKSDIIDAIRLRAEVFIIEQKCPPGWDPDEFDKTASHFIAVTEDKVIGTIRLREEPKTAAKFERIVVHKDYRRKGIGSALAKYVIEHARRKGFYKIWLQAQVGGHKMFEKVGFSSISKEHYPFNLSIPHIDMELLLK